MASNVLHCPEPSGYIRQQLFCGVPWTRKDPFGLIWKPLPLRHHNGEFHHRLAPQYDDKEDGQATTGKGLELMVIPSFTRYAGNTRE
jgi:hypothetical protein